MTQQKQPSLSTDGHAAEFLELFYPVYYRAYRALEDAIRGKLSRKQAAILWLIRSAGEEGRGMRRKEIVLRLQDWFDVSSPAITQTLRKMSRPPMSLVRMVEDANSGREKRVFLTPRGERMLTTMADGGLDFLRIWAAELPEELLACGVHFLRESVVAFERITAKKNGTPAQAPRPKPSSPHPINS